jgi:hypothetical protein
MKSLELKWGLIVGGTYLIWLYVSYWLGMHTSGLAMMQVMGLISLGITFVGFLLGLREVRLATPEITWTEGVKSGAIIAGIAALFAILTQVGYFIFVHPEFPDLMTEEMRQYFAAQQLKEEDLDAAIEAVKETFSMKAYMVKAGAGMFIVGVIFSAIVMALPRRLAK